MTKRVLKLTLSKRWFDLTAAGLKPEEYRKDCPWSRSRLDAGQKKGFREYDEIWYYNGGYFDENKFPFCRLKWNGCLFLNSDSIVTHCDEPIIHGENYFVTKNGSILETRNWQP